MFTGLIEKKGLVKAVCYAENACRLSIAVDFETLQSGESIAVNGVCLTSLSTSSTALEFDVSAETLRLTALGDLSVGDEVNLERAMLASSRFGGHYVSGHVDTTAIVQGIDVMGEYTQIELSGFNPEAMLYLIPKGSITVSGVSLTINSVVKQGIQFMLVPHTLGHTTLGLLKLGQRVNIEFDYLTQIIAHQLQLFGKLTNEVTP